MSIKKSDIKTTETISLKTSFWLSFKENSLFIVILLAFISGWIFVSIFYLIDIFTLIMIIATIIIVIVMFITWIYTQAKLNIAFEINDNLIKEQDKD